jgi:hypothetical protein
MAPVRWLASTRIFLAGLTPAFFLGGSYMGSSRAGDTTSRQPAYPPRRSLSCLSRALVSSIARAVTGHAHRTLHRKVPRLAAVEAEVGARLPAPRRRRPPLRPPRLGATCSATQLSGPDLKIVRKISASSEFRCGY